MYAFNRIALALYSLAWMAACAGLGALLWNQDQKLDLTMGSINLQAFVLSDDTDRWILTAILVLLGLLGVLTLLTAFRRVSQVSEGYVRLNAADGGAVEVSASAIEALLRTELESLPAVRKVNTVARVEGGLVRPDVTASVEPGASLVDLTSAISERIGIVLREQVGASRARRPLIHLTYDDINGRTAGRLRPQAVIAPPEGDLPPPPPVVPSPAAPTPVFPAPPPAAGNPLPVPPTSPQPPAATVVAPVSPAPDLPPVPPAASDDETPPAKEPEQRD